MPTHTFRPWYHSITDILGLTHSPSFYLCNRFTYSLAAPSYFLLLQNIKYKNIPFGYLNEDRLILPQNYWNVWATRVFCHCWWHFFVWERKGGGVFSFWWSPFSFLIANTKPWVLYFIPLIFVFCFFPHPSLFAFNFLSLKERELLSTTTPEKQTDIYMSSELLFHKTERRMCDTNVIFRKQHCLFYLSLTIDSFILGLIWLSSSGPLLSTA